jgi:hypothetical protein
MAPSVEITDRRHEAAQGNAASGNGIFPYRLGIDIFGLHQRNLPAMNVIVSEPGRIAYAPIPKNACTSLKIFFHEPVKGIKFEGLPDHVHGKFNYTAVDFEKFAADVDYFKFFVARDPLERFVSAYNNRVLFYRELSRKSVLMHSQDPPTTMAEFETLGLVFDPSLCEFAEHLDEYIAASNTIRHHFIPQHNFFHSRPQVFDAVYTVRTLHDLASRLGERLGRNVVFPKVQESRSSDRAASLDHLPRELLAKLMLFYAEDYRLLEPYLKL